MRAPTNSIGHAVFRLDGPIGWVAITETRADRDAALADLDAVERTPGAEYRVQTVLAGRN